MAEEAGLEITISKVEEVEEDATGTSESQQPSGTGTGTVTVIPVDVESEPSPTQGRKRQRTDASSESEDSAGPLWQVGSEGWDGSIWWKDCSEPFQTALETQYQAKLPKVKHECTTQTGRQVQFRHNLTKMLQTNLSNGITKMLRRISAISPPL